MNEPNKKKKEGMDVPEEGTAYAEGLWPPGIFRTERQPVGMGYRQGEIVLKRKTSGPKWCHLC